MALPKEPRQLMINLMYLVLTAMLALNVSSEILHAFKTINNSITHSNESIQSKNGELYMSLDANAQLPEARDRVRPFNDKAVEVRQEAEKMVQYLEEWKKKVVTASGGYLPDGDIKAESDIDASTRLLVEEKGGNQIKERIVALRSYMLDRVNPDVRAAFDKDLPLRIDTASKTDNNPQGDWATANFYNMPVMGAVTLFSKMQNDVRNSEATIINELTRESSAKTIKFDEIIALGVPKTSYALQGQKVEGNIMIAAYNKSVTPRISVSSGRVLQVKDGIGTWETTASGVGLQTVRGTVSLDFDGKTQSRPFEFQYMVGSAGAAMQLDAMNVVYAGIPNPVSVSAAGYNMEDVSLSIPGVTLSAGAGKGKYVINAAPNAATVTASVNVRTAAGVKTVGTYPIRVKRIPNPEAQMAGKTQGFMPSSTFRAQLGVVSELKDFLFDIRSVVKSFQFSMVRKKSSDIIGPFTVNGPRFSDNRDVQQLVESARPGDKIFIEEVKATLPDNTVRSINPIVFTLN
ncbi:MAG: gliding motility protein GldM [Sphingobacteriales bacterium]|nr:MAG: gliding motility protein GldM [Sphingobacteriales bacterium]